MKNLLKLIMLLILSVWQLSAQGLSVPSTMGKTHPRVFGKEMSVESVKKIVADKQWAKDIVDKTKQKVDPYVEFYKKDNTWLVSRLQMYWKTKSTQVYINGGTFVRADGESPVPTVKFPGTRNHITDYKTPKLEDI